MTNVFFTSDLHFSHELVATIRGFRTTEAHDEELIRRWNSVVSPKDTTWVLGDISAGRTEHPLELVARLNGTKHLISGNHDHCHSMHRRAHLWIPKYETVFASVQTFARRKMLGENVLLSHFPYDTDHTYVPRFNQYRLRNEHEWLLHGHTHGKERLHDNHEIHVGVDAWDLTPVNINTITELMSTYPNPLRKKDEG